MTLPAVQFPCVTKSSAPHGVSHPMERPVHVSVSASINVHQSDCALFLEDFLFFNPSPSDSDCNGRSVNIWARETPLFSFRFCSSLIHNLPGVVLLHCLWAVSLNSSVSSLRSESSPSMETQLMVTRLRLSQPGNGHVASSLLSQLLTGIK